MEAQEYLLNIVLKKKKEFQEKNSQFSLRAFARNLDISPSSLSEIINKKRILSLKMIEKISQHLKLNESERHELMVRLIKEKHLSKNSSQSSKILNNKRDVIKEDHGFLIENHLYYSFLSLMQLKSFQFDKKWIAEKLKCSKEEISEVINSLLALKMIDIDPRGNLVMLTNGLESTKDIPNLSVRNRHKLNLLDAQKSLEDDHIHLRDFSFMTIPANPRKIPLVKKLISDFQDQIELLLSDDKSTHVYELAIQLFPRTKIKPNEIYENYN
jgi:uncharacterized protein (TIGR02147 family)